MNRTTGAFLVVLLVASAVAEAQQSNLPLIGYLSRSSAMGNISRIKAFRNGMGERGQIEGQTFSIVFRFADGNYNRIWDVAADLVRLKPKVIVASGNGAVAAAKWATQTIPIVMVNATDPVGDRLISELARPGGNITGLTSIAPDLSGKRLELLKQAVPKTSHVAVLWNPVVPQSSMGYRPFNELKETERAAHSLGVQLVSVEARSGSDFEQAFSRMTATGANGLVVLTDGMFIANRSRIVHLASERRMPAIYADGEYILEGGLMAYAPSDEDLARRAAIYVEKLLRGIKPADLPVEQPMKFELVINLKTAKQIGLNISLDVLARADKVIK